MYESVQNNAKTYIRDNSDYDQGSGEQGSCNVPPNFGEMPPIPSKLANNIENLNDWLIVIVELMKRIHQVPIETLPNDDKLAHRVARRNPKAYDEMYDPVELEEWVLGIEKIFIVVEVPEEKKVNIGTYYLTGEADIWWNTVKDKLVGPKFTWNKFMSELREKFYSVMIQR